MKILPAKNLSRGLFAVGMGGLGLAALGALALSPLSTRDIVSRPRPAAGYDEAVARFVRLTAAEGAAINPLCRSRLLSHGRRVERAVVLLHGITNCPRQMERLADELHAAGCNVLVPLMPRNGLADRHNDALHQLSAPALAAYGDEAIDIAVGLGEQVVALGLSANGIVAAWLSQYRVELRRAVVVAPSFDILQLASWQQVVVRNLFCRLPPIRYVDSGAVAARKAPHTSLTNSSRAMGEVERLGVAVRRAARVRPPRCPAVLLVTGASDVTIVNRSVDQLAATWQANGATGVERYEFPAELGLPHDIIDPLQAGQRVEVTYPVLTEFLLRS